MKHQLLQNQTTEEAAIASRRSFLTRLAYGSLLAMSGSVVQAAAKHPAKKVEAKPAKSHAKTDLKADHHAKTKLKGKDVLAHDKHSHIILSKHDSHSAKHDSRIHTLHHDDRHSLHRGHEHIAMREHDKHSRIHHTLTKEYHHGQMREFALQEDLEDFSAGFDGNRFQAPAPRPNRFVAANSYRNGVMHRTLSLQNMTTGDSLDVTYFEKGQYLPDAMDEISYLYRDHLTDEMHPIDPALLDQLHDLQATLGVGNRSIHVICGYRSPYTNAHLRQHSRGVAKNSLHMQGRAIDIRIPGVDSTNIRDAALSMARGGVGYYPGSNFVHLDTGNFRTW